MPGSLPSLVRGLIAALLLLINSLFWCSLLFGVSALKWLLPLTPVRRRIDPLLNAIAGCWIRGNSGWMALTQRTRWDVQGLDSLQRDGWALVNCNHQSWVDIFVLQHLLNRRIPMLKFFLKQQLIYVPVMGLAWWALDFPFMQRHSAAALQARPELRQQDRDATRRACEKFALVPTSVMNFAEGTRFSRAKHHAQGSPYRHLLKPKAGALALALHAMGGQFQALIDVTIVYPAGAPRFWDFLCGRCPQVIVRLQRRPIPADFSRGDYEQDADFRGRVQAWLAQLWSAKDEQIDALLAAAPPRDATGSPPAG